MGPRWRTGNSGAWSARTAVPAALVVHEALQQSVNRYALPLRFLPDSRFGLWRDVEAHANSSLLRITVYFTPLSQLCHGYLAGLSHTSTGESGTRDSNQYPWDRTTVPAPFSPRGGYDVRKLEMWPVPVLRPGIPVPLFPEEKNIPDVFSAYNEGRCRHCH